MTLYDYLAILYNCNDSIELLLHESVDPIYDGSTQYLLNSIEFNKLMSYRIVYASVSKTDEIKFYTNPTSIQSTVISHEVYLKKPSIISKISYYINLLKDRIRTTYRSVDGKYNIFRIIGNKYSLVDTQETWYMSSFRNSLPANNTTFSINKPGDICTYTADVVYRYALNRYKNPIFRLKVLNRTNGNFDNLFSTNGECLVDDSMVFTLEKNPRPLQSYQSIKRRLKGNVISEERIIELVNIVSMNYDEILAAWYSHPSKFGSCYNEYGLNIQELKFDN